MASGARERHTGRWRTLKQPLVNSKSFRQEHCVWLPEFVRSNGSPMFSYEKQTTTEKTFPCKTDIIHLCRVSCLAWASGCPSLCDRMCILCFPMKNQTTTETPSLAELLSYICALSLVWPGRLAARVCVVIGFSYVFL